MDARPGRRPERTGNQLLDTLNDARFELEVLEQRLQRVDPAGARHSLALLRSVLDRVDSEFLPVTDRLAEGLAGMKATGNAPSGSLT